MYEPLTDERGTELTAAGWVKLEATDTFHSGTMSIENVLCSSQDLNYGECNSAMFSVTISDVEDVTDERIYVYEIVDGYGYPVPLFTGRVKSAELQSDRNSRKIIAYDALHAYMDYDVTDWYKSLFPKTQKAEYAGAWNNTATYTDPAVVLYDGVYYKYLCNSADQITISGTTYNVSEKIVGRTPAELVYDSNYSAYIYRYSSYDPYEYESIKLRWLRTALISDIGLTQTQVTLINDNLDINYQDNGRLTAGTILQAIGQLNAAFGHMSPDGIFQWITLPSDTVDYTDNIRSETSYSEYMVNVPDGIAALAADGTELYKTANGDNLWVIQNFLLYNADAEAALTNLVPALSTFGYMPAKMKAIISLPAQLGSRITFTTATGETITTYSLSETLSGVQLISQTISASGNLNRDNSTTIYDAVEALKARTQALQSAADIAGSYATISRNTAEAAQNNAVVGTNVLYAQGDSDTTAPSTGWSTTAPSWTDGKYMWQKTVTLYGDGTSEETACTCITGAKGNTGAQGPAGADGTSVTILGSYNTLAELEAAHPTGSAGDSYMVGNDLYVWDGSHWVDVGQIKGTDGSSAYVHVAYSTASDGSANFSLTPFDGASYIGYLTNASSTASTDYTAYSWALFKGEKGDTGARGAQGVSVTSITPHYLATGASSGVTTSTAGWTTAVQAMTAQKCYLWYYETVNGSAGAALSTTTPVIIGRYAQDGQKGDPGAAGRSVVSTQPQYYASTSDQTLSGGEWTYTMPDYDSSLYLWVRTETVYQNPSSTEYTEEYYDNSWQVMAAAVDTADDAYTVASERNHVYHQETAPDDPDLRTGDTWFDTSDGFKVYRYSGTDPLTDESKTQLTDENGETLYGEAWTEEPFSNAAIAEAGISAAHLAVNSVTAEKIAAGAVTTEKITAGAVTAAEIAAGAVTAEKIVSGAVTTDKIEAGAITAAKIDTGAVTAAKIAADAVTADAIAANAVTSEAIAADAVTAREIAANAVTADSIAANAVTTKAIAADAVTASEIATNAVTTDAIAAGAVTAKEIAANTITAANIATGAVTADEIAAGAVTATEISAGAITTEKLDIGAVTADKISANAVTASKISANAVTADKISSSSVTADKIATGAVTTAKIDAGAVTAVKIAAGAITTDKLAANAVTAAKIAAGAITTDKLAANAVTAAKIAAGAITTDKLAANAVTAAKINVADLFSQNITATGTITGAKLRGTDAVITKGTIGGFAIDSTGIHNSKLHLYSNPNGVGIQLGVGSGASSPITAIDNDRFMCTSGSFQVSVGVESGMEGVACFNDNMGTDVLVKAGYDTGMVVENTYTVDGSVNKAGFIYNNANNLGIYDYTNSRWVFRYSMTNNVAFMSANEYAVRIGAGNTAGTYSFMPRTSANAVADGKVHCGASGSRWHTVWSVNGVKTSSDERDKNIIGELGEKHRKLFMDLKPVEFQFKNDPDIIHFGVGAQTTEKTMKSDGFVGAYGFVSHDAFTEPVNGRTDAYSVNYSELLMLSIPVIQQQQREIETLKQEVNELKSIIHSLKEVLNG